MNSRSFINVRDFGYLTFFIAFILFFYHLASIDKIYFDETHYIPAAKEWSKMAPTTNTEHPPLGKFLIATSIDFLGDNPIGWRAASAVAGSIAILLCYLISMAIFEDLALSMTIGLFSLFNFWFYIQSRIAMLDIFMVTFYLAGFYYYLRYKLHSHQKCHFYLSSLFWGLAVAIKWSSIFIYFPFLIIALATELKSIPKDLRLKTVGKYVLFGLFSVAVYFTTFLPYLFVTTQEKRTFFQILFTFPLQMLRMQESVGGHHPYSSAWYTWPVIIRPIWYEFIQSADKAFFKGVVLIANPWQMALGILAVFILIVRWFKTQAISKMTLVLFLCSWLAWAIAPRKISFFYYFFPSAIFYSFLIPMALRELFQPKTAKTIMIVLTVISFGFFVYFYPVLSGSSTPEVLRPQWYWLKSWI